MKDFENIDFISYSELLESKKVYIYIDQLKRYVKAKVKKIPFVDSETFLVIIEGSLNKSYDFEIHISNEKQFNMYQIKKIS